LLLPHVLGNSSAIPNSAGKIRHLAASAYHIKVFDLLDTGGLGNLSEGSGQCGTHADSRNSCRKSRKRGFFGIPTAPVVRWPGGRASTHSRLMTNVMPGISRASAEAYSYSLKLAIMRHTSLSLKHKKGCAPGRSGSQRRLWVTHSIVKI
jgi:hypothetical protein